MKRTFALLLSVLLLVGPARSVHAETDGPSPEQAVMLLRAYSETTVWGTCSAFVIDGVRGYMLTALHCKTAIAAETYFVVAPDGSSWGAQEVFESEENDIMVLEVPGLRGHPGWALKPAFDFDRQAALAVGYPDGVPDVVVAGTTISPATVTMTPNDDGTLDVTLTLTPDGKEFYAMPGLGPGSSGGPIVTFGDHAVLGVMQVGSRPVDPDHPGPVVGKRVKTFYSLVAPYWAGVGAVTAGPSL